VPSAAGDLILRPALRQVEYTYLDRCHAAAQSAAAVVHRMLPLGGSHLLAADAAAGGSWSALAAGPLSPRNAAACACAVQVVATVTREVDLVPSWNPG